MACAQSWLAPAYADQPMRGTAAAAGAVIWSHGRSVDSEDATAPTPPYLAALAAGGWDTFRFNRMRAGDTLSASADSLVGEAHRLKQKGYRRIALAGQSFGGFLSLMAADASDDVDAVITTAPAAFGDYVNSQSSWRANATKLYPLLKQVRRARVMMFYFHGDDFDPGGRGERSRDILDERQLGYVVIDQPPALTGHWAAGTPLFAERYGGCILAFLGGDASDPEQQCGRAVWAAAPRPIAGAPSRSVQAALR
jgi:dienelactone hydrolase